MKHYNLFLTVLLASTLLIACNDFLDLKPQGQENSDNFMNSEDNAVRAVNGIYDLLGQIEGKAPDGVWLSNHPEFFFANVITDDAEKGSNSGDGQDVQSILNWSITPQSSLSKSTWIHGFWGISRSNYVLTKLPDALIDEKLKERLMGEAYFLRGYYYFYLLRHFGGVPIFEKPVSPSEFGKVGRASLHQTFVQIEKDLLAAIDRLPERSDYKSMDMGRATKGAARAYLARVLSYQIGIDQESNKTWNDVYTQTNHIIQSGQYQLMSNFAALFEPESENCAESIFEIQALDGADAIDPASTGTATFNYQGNRVDNKGANTGWGYNNPTQDLVNAFDPSDPRLSSTIYGIGYNNEILYGQKMKFNRTEQSTNYLNRKAALQFKPSIPKASGRNVLQFRYADILLLHAEACYHTNKEGDARLFVNKIRDRARTSTYCKGYNLTQPNDYPAPAVVPNIPVVTASGVALLEAIWLERRLELAMENVRTIDLIRTGRYLDRVSKVKDIDRISSADQEAGKYYEEKYVNYREKCTRYCLTGKNGIKFPVIPIPSTEVESWGLTQNPY